MATDHDLKNEIVYYLVHNRVTGSHKITVETAVTHAAIASHDRGRAKDLIDEMLANPTTPIEGYGGGSRSNIRLTGLQEGVNYLEANSGDIPFGLE
jgi:hypothetical protein